jgi:hypothetical protein
MMTTVMGLKLSQSWTRSHHDGGLFFSIVLRSCRALTWTQFANTVTVIVILVALEYICPTSTSTYHLLFQVVSLTLSRSLSEARV